MNFHIHIWRENLFPTVELDEDGIFIETHIDDFVSVGLALYVADMRKKIAGLEKKPLLVQFKAMVGFDPKLRDYTDIILANVSALGFYINCETKEGREAKKNIEGFYEISPYPVPVAVFDDRDQAIDWLKGYV